MMRSYVKGFVPPVVFQMRLLAREWIKLRLLRKQACDPVTSAPISDLPLDAILASSAYSAELEALQPELDALCITDQAHGVNLGDRRAIYHLVRHLQPRRVLEVGTHVGASTAYICAATRMACAEHPGEVRTITTVDIVDVNDTISKPWLRAGSRYAPKEVVRRMGCVDMVRFVVANSLDFLARAEETYDLIFLDGDHTAVVNYREISAALPALSPGGYILLHDYFPQLRPLWDDGPAISEPSRSEER
ncbi:MAG: class I SAM-dependent methyltransferase, partial [Oscillochloris sp.]|nr:class I SAM-dependent methyltransferase [Oscillochloris sp.]